MLPLFKPISLLKSAFCPVDFFFCTCLEWTNGRACKNFWSYYSSDKIQNLAKILFSTVTGHAWQNNFFPNSNEGVHEITGTRNVKFKEKNHLLLFKLRGCLESIISFDILIVRKTAQNYLLGNQFLDEIDHLYHLCCQMMSKAFKWKYNWVTATYW